MSGKFDHLKDSKLFKPKPMTKELSKEQKEQIEADANDYLDKNWPLPKRRKDMSDEDWDRLIGIVGDHRTSEFLTYTAAASKYLVRIKELEDGLREIVDEGYDAYDNEQHLVVQRWLEKITKLLTK